jgi:uncharacterized protein (TIGR02453 family)
VTFEGWPPSALQFFEGLEADNSKAYWQAHRDAYESDVRGPMEALLVALAGEFGEGKIFRPNRDVRFSADKSPYKTNIGATLAQGGYIQFSADGLAAGAGYYHLESDQLERFRAAVDDDDEGGRLLKVVAKIEKAGIEISSHGSLKTAPRGFAKDHPRIDYLRRKNLIAWQEWPVEPWLETAAVTEHVAGFLRAAQPLRNWLDRCVGPTEKAPERR